MAKASCSIVRLEPTISAHKAVSMLRLFKKSNLVRTYGIGISLVASALYALAIYTTTGFSLRLVAPIPLFLVLLVLSLFISSLMEEAKHQAYLSLLYTDLMPTLFIERYTPLLEQKEIRPTARLVLTSHLANGYAYKADYACAIRLMQECPLPQGKQRYNAEALVTNNLCSYYLLMGDKTNAKVKIEELEKILLQAKGHAVKMSKNYSFNLESFYSQYRLLTGQPINADTIRSELSHTTNLLYMTRIRLNLAKVLLAEGETEAAKEQLQIIMKKGGETIILQEATAIWKEENL